MQELFSQHGFVSDIVRIVFVQLPTVMVLDPGPSTIIGLIAGGLSLPVVDELGSECPACLCRASEW